MMYVDKLYKFSDGTLNDVWSALDDILKKIRMKYLPQTIYREDCDGLPKRPTMNLNLWSYKVVRHRYSNPMIQPEPKGPTQGYLLVSVEVLRIIYIGGFDLLSLDIGADNHPPMLEKDMYDSWKSRMELYMLNRPHGRMILESVEQDPLF
nr:hypothetical protein [Tanacetum cinerariifolium]